MQNDFDHYLSLSVAVTATDRAIFSSFPLLITIVAVHGYNAFDNVQIVSLNVISHTRVFRFATVHSFAFGLY